MADTHTHDQSEAVEVSLLTSALSVMAAVLCAECVTWTCSLFQSGDSREWPHLLIPPHMVVAVEYYGLGYDCHC